MGITRKRVKYCIVEENNYSPLQNNRNPLNQTPSLPIHKKMYFCGDIIMHLKKSILSLLLLGFCALAAVAQCSDFTDLTGPGVVCKYGNTLDPDFHTGIAPGRYTVISQQGTDLHTNEMLPLLPDGENVVIKLGNDLPFSESEAVNYYFTVDSTMSILLIKFAVVLHETDNMVGALPCLYIRVRDMNGDPVHSCAEYDIRTNSVIPGLTLITITTSNFIWMPWSTLAIDLSSHIGQSVWLQMRTYDGAEGGSAYAYYTAHCVSNSMTVDNCNGNQISLMASDGFSNYQWNNGTNNQSATYNISDYAVTAQCQVQADIGCPIVFFGTLMPQNAPIVNQLLYDTICQGESYQQPYFNLPQQTEVGLHTFSNHFMNVNNCTDGGTYHLFLTVIPREYHYYDMACQGESYNNHGFQYNSLTVGTFVDSTVAVSMNGCDSITILHLTVDSSFTLPNAVSGPTEVCCNTEQVFVLQNAEGLPSIVWNIPDGAEIVSGQGTQSLHVSFSNFTTNPAVINVIGANGCGSGSIPITVQLMPSYNLFYRDTICTGTAYNNHGFTAGPFDTTGLFTYSYSGVSASGCDSNATLQLWVTGTPEISAIAVPGVICLGDSVELHAIGANANVIIDTLHVKAFVGDILCTDGTIVHPSDWPCGQTAKGIVFFVDSTQQHGWALALENDGCVWFGSNGTTIPGMANYPSTREAIFDFDGYTNTQIIRSAGNAATFPAIYLLDFENGWYLPAAGQLRLLYSVIMSVNQSLQLVGGVPINMQLSSAPSTSHYWSSTIKEGITVYTLSPAFGVKPSGGADDRNIRGVCDF